MKLFNKDQDDDKEQNVQYIRLDMLKNISNALASDDFDTATEWIKNFMNTVKDNSPPGRKINAAYNVAMANYDKGVNIIEHKTQLARDNILSTDTEGYPPTMYKERKTYRLKKDMLRRLNKELWTIAFDNELISLE